LARCPESDGLSDEQVQAILDKGPKLVANARENGFLEKEFFHKEILQGILGYGPFDKANSQQVPCL